jgi:hypothetical protein
MSTLDAMKGQKIRPAIAEIGNACEPIAKTGSAAPIPRKIQMLRPGWRQFDRVQTLMGQEPALQRFLGAKTHEAKKRSGEVMVFSPEAVDVAEALFDKGKDAAAERREVILGIAQDIFIRNQANPGSDSNRPSTPPSSAVGLGQVDVSTTDNKSESAQIESSQGETMPMAQESMSGEAAQVEVIPSKAPIGLPDSLKDFTIEIKKRVRDQSDQFVASTILIGEAFLAGTKKYNRTLKQLAAEVGLAYVTVTQYVKIAERFGRKQKCWAPAQLPASVDSLMRLARLEEDQLDDAIKTGKLKSDMGRKEVKALLAQYRPASSKSSRCADAAKVSDEGFNLSLKTVRQQLVALREAVEVCQRLPNFHGDLLLLLEGHAAWTKDCIGKLLRKAV